MVTLFFVKVFVLLQLLDYDVNAVVNKRNGTTKDNKHRSLPYNHQPNLTVFLGYANKPFETAAKLQNDTNKLNSTRTGAKSISNNISSNSSDYEMEESRSKRGVFHLYNMVSCATGCNPLIYKGYGCYCGFLGSGYPVDGIDRCCKNHDWCYDIANCPMYLQYFVPYYWKCFHNRPLCAIDHGEFGGPGSCAQRLCECDRVLSECLSRYPCPSTRALCRSSPWRLIQNTIMIF